MKGTHSDKKKENRSFYMALGVCLIAVGIATWATFDSVSKVTGRYSDSLLEEGSELSQESEVESEPEESASATEGDPSKVEETQVQAPVESKPEESEEPEKPVTATPIEEIDFQSPLGDGTNVYKAYSGDELVYSETMKDYRVHNGVDLSGKRGDVVHAMAEGTVSAIYQDDLLGNVIEITHGEAVVSYCGLGDTALVRTGDTVQAGQDIGSLTEVPSENIETPHLHLMAQVNGAWVDPMTLLN